MGLGVGLYNIQVSILLFLHLCCLPYICLPYGYSLDKNAPHVYELIVDNVNYLWLLSIYDILVHKQNKYHVKNQLISASSFCVVMKKAESVSTVLQKHGFHNIGQESWSKQMCT